MSDAVFRWAALLVTQGVILAGLILTYLSTRRKVSDVDTKVDTVDTKVDTAAGEAKRAAEAAAPIANGFAGRTSASLSAIEAMVADLMKPGGRLERIERQAERGDERTSRIEGALLAHIGAHAESDVLKH